jgi:hypothetical protein
VAGKADFFCLRNESPRLCLFTVDHDFLLGVVMARTVAPLTLNAGLAIEFFGQEFGRNPDRSHVTLETPLIILRIVDAYLCAALSRLLAR